METGNSSNRIQYIDIAKCIGMFLVIHNHWALDYNNSEIKIFIASFHMPLFFLLSGLVTKCCSDFEVVKKYIVKRIGRILVPYYLFSFVYCGFDLKRVCLIIYGSNISIGSADGIGGSWFLPCFLVADIVACLICFFAVRNQKNRSLPYAVLMFFISWLLNMIEIRYGFPMNFDVALSGTGLILMGIYLRNSKVFDKIESMKFKHRFGVLSLTLVITCLFAFFNSPAYENSYHRLVMALGYYGIYPMFVIGGLIGSVFLITLSMCLQKTNISFFLQRIGAYTYTILLVHQFCIEIIEKLVGQFYVRLNFLFPICLSVVCLITCYLIAYIIAKIAAMVRGYS